MITTKSWYIKTIRFLLTSQKLTHTHILYLNATILSQIPLKHMWKQITKDEEDHRIKTKPNLNKSKSRTSISLIINFRN